MQNFDRNTNRHFCSTKIVLLPRMLKIYVDLPTFAQNKIFLQKRFLFLFCLFISGRRKRQYNFVDNVWVQLYRLKTFDQVSDKKFADLFLN